MSVILGIDTGGTYTDSVILEPKSRKVIKKSKAFTTRQDLLIGISESYQKLSFQTPEDISMVCLSTTLATNAVVEHQSGRVGALLIGRCASDKLPSVRTHQLRGVMDIKGRIIEDISPDEASAVVRSWKGQVDAVAISGYASVRNPEHEKRIKAIVRRELQVPVVCAHELSTSLGFHDRTVTAILNAALIPNIRDLIDSTCRVMQQYGIHAPIMIVKGDGSLMHADVALDRPIETVLSGPAASIVGGLFLSDVKDALILDMGGTTSDLALVENGHVAISSSGATVGGWKTQLRAARISTFGIGGDSRFHLSLQNHLHLGPKRVLPLCVAGIYNPNLTEELEQYRPPEEYELFDEQICECYRFLRLPRYRDPTPSEQKLFGFLADGIPHSLFYLAHYMECDAEKMGITELVDEGVLQRSGLTPTDLLHISGRMNRWNTETARMGAALLAQRMLISFEDFTEQALSKVHETLRKSCIQSGLDFDNCGFNLSGDTAQFFLSGGSRLLQTKILLNRPVVALGAPVTAWLPEVCRQLCTKVIIPEHAEVANAVGAAVGQVMITAEALIRPDQYHKGYIVHTSWGNRWFEQLENAEQWARQSTEEQARKNTAEAGSNNCTVTVSASPTYALTTVNQKVFIENKITATAIGSPNWIEKEN